MKLSYWGFIKEKVFKEWLDSFDIDYNYVNCVINRINNEREYELLDTEWDLIIKWNVSYKQFNDELGGCITRIYLSTWNNGFNHRSKFIELKISYEKVIKSLKIKSEIDESILILEKQILNVLDNYMFRINTQLSKKLIRDRKIKEVLN
jgi:hypothetical protein